MATPLRIALGVVALALVGVLGAEAWYLFAEPAGASTGRPVVVGDLAARAAVDAAAQDLTVIASTSYHNYDEQVAEATTLMTPEYAAAYSRTTADLRAAFVDARQEIAAEVVLSGVVTATPDRAEALVFLDQQVSRDGQPAVRVPYQALVTMTHTSRGWLVSAIETR